MLYARNTHKKGNKLERPPWYLEEGFDAMEQHIKCPACGWKGSFFVRDDYPPTECSRCGYSGNGLDFSSNTVRFQAAAANSNQPNPDIPFTTFDGWLKFHNPCHLTPPMAAIIDFCCPGFLSQEANEETKLIRARRLTESGAKNIVSVPADQARDRRWSGDSNLAITRAARLSRSSYFGVCEGESVD